MAILLAALSSLVYGTADFTGGFASRRNDGMIVTVVSQVCGLLALGVAIAVWPHVSVTAADMWWGGLAGAGGGIGLMFFYPALATGPMSVVAPTTAVCSAVLPVVVGLATGDRPGLAALVGIIAALPAIVLVAHESGSHGRANPRIIGSSILAGLGFGIFFVGIGEAHRAAGLWPLVGARMASITIVGLTCLISRKRFAVAKGTLHLVAVAGVLDVAANGLYEMAATRGLLSVVAVLGSLYPVSTVILAMILLRERLTRAQAVGIVLAGSAVALIAVGS